MERTLQHHHPPSLIQGIQMTTWTRLGGLSVALVILGLGAPQASACGWWWACDDAPYAYRPGPNGYGYGYRNWPRAYYGYRAPAWGYGYSNPARGWDPYAAWPSTSIPQSRWYLSTTLPSPANSEVGLTMPVTTAFGLQAGGLPAKGPSLFGPNPPPAALGYYYSSYNGSRTGYYYRSPSSSYYAPPPLTASWWATTRRRR
jgi:hypothetical protein